MIEKEKGIKKAVRRIAGWVRGTLQGESTTSSPGSGPSEPDTAHSAATPNQEQEEKGAQGVQSNLFRCPECGTVYIAMEKQECSKCDVAVELVA